MLPQRHRGVRMRHTLQHPASPASAYVTKRGLFSPREVRSLVSPQVWREGSRQFNAIRHVSEHADSNGAVSAQSESGMFERVSRAELSTYTPPDSARYGCDEHGALAGSAGAIFGSHFG